MARTRRGAGQGQPESPQARTPLRTASDGSKRKALDDLMADANQRKHRGAQPKQLPHRASPARASNDSKPSKRQSKSSSRNPIDFYQLLNGPTRHTTKSSYRKPYLCF